MALKTESRDLIAVWYVVLIKVEIVQDQCKQSTYEQLE